MDVLSYNNFITIKKLIIEWKIKKLIYSIM